MKLSKTELRIMGQIANGDDRIVEIAPALKKSKAQVYRAGRSLLEKGFITHFNGVYSPAKNTHTILLLHILGEFPSLVEPLSDSGLKMLTALLEPKSIIQILKETGLKRTQIFKKIKQARAISLVKKQDGSYSINEKLWGNAVDFLKEMKRFEETIDARVPANSVIYFKNEKEVVFSNRKENCGTLTAFSEYKMYGIKILSTTNYFYLPKRKLTKKDVFQHSLQILEKEPDVRNIIFLALFYAKFRKSLARIKHPIIEKIKKILEGQFILHYPTHEEIKERAEVYDIRL